MHPDLAVKDAAKKTRAKMSKGYTEIKLATEEKVTKDIEKKMGEESKDEEEFKEPKSKLPAQL